MYKSLDSQIVVSLDLCLMKYDNLRAFEKHLQGASPGHLSPVYLVLSKESFERKTAVDALVAALKKGEKEGALSVQTFDGDKLAIQQVMSELHTLSFFAKKTVVIITNGEKLTKPSMAPLEAYFEKPSRDAYLIISAESVNRSTNFYKKGEKAGIILDIPEAKQWEKEKSVAEWIRQRVASEGIGISPAAIQLIQKQAGTDLGLIDGEINKLLCYIGERKEVTVQDVGAICASVNIETGWQLGDAIFRRDAASALRITKALLGDGVPFLALLRQIRSQFQVKYQIASLMASGGTPEDVIRQYPYMRGQLLEKNIQAATQYGVERFRKGMLKIDHTETQAKNSQADEGFLAELLIATIAHN